jgi:tRNA pseudouridine38-40 synthase
MAVAYDGRPFRGWQSQATKDAVQDHLEAAFASLTGEKVTVHGAGRTDTGVHALAQVAHVTVPGARVLRPDQWLLALNGNLPAEIRVLRVSRARADFHARFDARGKIYTYRVWNAPAFHPLEIGRAWHLPGRLDLDQLRAGIALLTGTHDFAGFAANRGEPSPHGTVRTIREIALQRRGALITLRFTGDGFLYKMVRLLTGTLLRHAQGRLDLAFLHELLTAEGRKKTHFLAPAEGLYLTKVLY